MYKCRVEKRVCHNVNDINDYTALQYELELVTAPQPGEVLKDDQWFSGPLIKVIWAVDEDCFHCRVEDEFPFSQGYETYSHEWIVSSYQQDGWSLGADKIVRFD